jgi:hypothetical protein
MAGGHAKDMTGRVDRDKAKAQPESPPRRFAMLPAAALLAPIVRPAFRGRAPATAQLLADWDAIVGPAIAAVTTPRRLFSGTLAIACPGPVAMELQHLAPQLIERINGHLGRVAVTRLRFVHDAPPRPAVPPAPPPRALAAASRAVAALPEGELRDALERLGRIVLAAGRR